MDDERLKNGGSILTEKYLDFLLVFKINFVMLYLGNTAAEIIYNRADHKKENMKF